MINSTHLQLLFSHPGSYLLLGSICLIAFTLFIYRYTNPPVSKALKILLSVLRSTVLVLILFVLFQTVLSISFSEKIEPTLAIAIDTSSSMSLTDKDGSREEQLQNILSAPQISNLGNEFQLRYYQFSTTAVPLSVEDMDSLLFWGDETNIHQAVLDIVEQNQQNNLQGILLLTDGNYNAGGNPARSSGFQNIPIHSIAIGSAEEIPDVEVVQIQSNATAFINQPTQIKATVRATGISETSLPVHLYIDDQKTDSRTLTFKSSPSEQNVDFSYTPDETGQKRISIRVPALENEFMTQNNQDIEYIDVFKSKIKILIIAGYPMFDISFFKRHFDDEKYEISTLVQKSPSTFYEQNRADNELENFDFYILLDYPTQASSDTFIRKLADTIDSAAKPLLIAPGGQFALDKFSGLSSYTPLLRTKQSQHQVLPVPSATGASHPILEINTTGADNFSVWKQLSPLPAFLREIELQPGSQTLVYAQSEQPGRSREPLISIREARQKSIAVFAQELWRWDLRMARNNEQNQFFNTLLRNMLKWLETDINNKLIQVKLQKTVFNFGEPVNMRIRVIDENMNALSDATVSVRITKDDYAETIKAQAIGDGNFQLELQPQTPGEYTVSIQAMESGREIGKESIRFSVGEYSKEQSDLQAAHELLQTIAQQTNALYLRPDSLKPLSTLNGTTLERKFVQEKELWNNRILLLLLISLLVLEWFIRKRTGMV